MWFKKSKPGEFKDILGYARDFKLIYCPACRKYEMAYLYNHERVVVSRRNYYMPNFEDYDDRMTKARCLACLFELNLVVVPKIPDYYILEEIKNEG